MCEVSSYRDEIKVEMREEEEEEGKEMREE